MVEKKGKDEFELLKNTLSVQSEESIDIKGESVSPQISSNKLCYIIDDEDDTKQLVICEDDIGKLSPDKLVNVKIIEDMEVKEVAAERVKLFKDVPLDDDDDEQFQQILNIVKKVLSVHDPEPLRLALSQKLIAKDTDLSESDGDLLIHFASRMGTIECLKYLLCEAYETFPYEVTNEEGYNILHSATQGGLKDNVELILTLVTKSEDETQSGKTANADEFLNAKSSTGSTALHLCSVYNKKDLIRPLLKGGVKLKGADNKGNTLLHIAAQKNNLDILKRVANYHITDRKEDKDVAMKELKEGFLLQNKEKKIPILLTEDRAVVDLILKYSDLEAVVDKEIGRLIHLAAAENIEVLAEALMDTKADKNIVNSKGFSALKVASKRGFDKIVGILLEGGADPNYIGKKLPGFSPLNNAVQFGQLACAKLLIDHGANLVHKNMTNTALHSASYGGHANIVEFLIKDSGMDVNQTNNANKTALFQSITQGHNSVAKVLLRYGADPNVILNTVNETLLHVAVREGRKEILLLLLAAKAMPDAALKDGTTPLMLSVTDDRADFIPKLMSHGITLAKKDEQGNTVLHYIAKHDSCVSARYILRRIGLMKGISQEFQLYKNENSDKKTPYQVAIECRNENVLKIFIKYASTSFFQEKPQELHNFLELKLFDTLKEIFDGFVKIDESKGKVTANTIVFDSNDDGEYPNSPGFKSLKQSLLHKLNDCQDQELKYHPLVSIIIDKKLRFYRWWYVISFLFYLFFLGCLSYALIQASTLCDSRIWLYETPYDWVRGICECICLFYFIFFLVNEAIEFIIEWIQLIEDRKSEVESKPLTVNYLSDDGGKSFLSFIFVSWNKFTKSLKSIDEKLKFFFSTILQYFDGVYNFIDWGGLISFIILIILRASSSYIQWSFAGLTFIFFSLSLIKYTRIFPALGAYVNSVFRIFVIDIPRFFVIVVIILIAFMGGIHLAARQQPIFPQSSVNGSLNGEPYPICNDSRSAFFWFNQDLTRVYDLRRPLLSGLIFILDGGPGNHEEDLFNTNIFFAVVYLAFAFTIIVVLLNILIAQLSETYGEIVKENSYHYKIDLVVSLELKSNLAFLFGKRFRKFTTIESMVISLPFWNKYKDDSPNRNVDQVVLDIKGDLTKTQKTIDREFDTIKNSYDELNGKVNDLGDVLIKTNDQLDRFGETLNELKKLILNK